MPRIGHSVSPIPESPPAPRLSSPTLAPDPSVTPTAVTPVAGRASSPAGAAPGTAGVANIRNSGMLTRARLNHLKQRAAAELAQPSTRSFEILLETSRSRLAAAQGRAPGEITPEVILQAWTDGDCALGQRFAEIVAGEQEHAATMAEITALERDVVRQLKSETPTLTPAQLYVEVRKRLVAGDSPEQRALAKNNAVAMSLNQRFETLRKKIAPQQPEIDARWTKIEATLPESTKVEEIPAMKANYSTTVNNWLNDIDALQQLASQKRDLSLARITLADMRPGDILVRKERLPESIAHAFTLTGKAQGSGFRHNGIENNKGDINSFHVAMWSGSDISWKQIVEARGGLGTTNALRVLEHAIQEGEYFIYRPDPLMAAAVPGQAPRPWLDSGDSVGAAAAVIGSMWANVDETTGKKALQYSKALLGGSMSEHDMMIRMTEDAKRDAMNVAADPYDMLQQTDRESVKAQHLAANPGAAPLTDEQADRIAGERFSENLHYSAVRKPKPARDENNRIIPGKTVPDVRTGGETCSTFVIRMMQTAILQMAMQKEMLDTVGNLRAEGRSAAEIARHLEKFDPVDGKISPATEEVFSRAQGMHFTGLLGFKAEGVSPRTIDAFGKAPGYKFMGTLGIEKKDVLRAEERFPDPSIAETAKKRLATEPEVMDLPATKRQAREVVS
jgi:hypothetical protein